MKDPRVSPERAYFREFYERVISTVKLNTQYIPGCISHINIAARDKSVFSDVSLLVSLTRKVAKTGSDEETLGGCSQLLLRPKQFKCRQNGRRRALRPEALFAMHLRYDAGEKKAWWWKRKEGEESGTNDVDNNDSKTATSDFFHLIDLSRLRRIEYPRSPPVAVKNNQEILMLKFYAINSNLPSSLNNFIIYFLI